MQKPKLCSEDIDYIRTNIDNFKTNKELAVKYNLTVKQISDLLYYNKIRRSYTNHGRVTCNENFFNEYNKLSCYWAGFIAADGCISLRPNKKDKFLTINLQEKDKAHLEKFVKHVGGINLNIITRSATCNNKKFEYVSVIMYNNKICDSLAENFKIFSNKTLLLEYPNIPDEYSLDYIRGYIDGDGCLSVYKDRTSYRISLSFCGNEEFVLAIARKLKYKYSVTSRKKLYLVSYNSRISYTIIKLLYANSFALQRKIDKLPLFNSYMTNKQKLNYGV